MPLVILGGERLSGHEAPVYALCAYSGAEGRVLSGAGDGWIAAWGEGADGKLLAKTEGVPIYSLAYSYADNLLLVGDMHGNLHAIDLFGRAAPRLLPAHPKGVYGLEWTEPGQRFLSWGADGCLTLWDARLWKPIESLRLSGKALRCLALHPNGLPLAAVGASDSCIYIVDIQRFKLIKNIENAHSPSVFTLCYSPDGSGLWSGGRDARIALWNTEDYALQHRIPAHIQTVNHLAFRPEMDGQQPLLVSASRDGSIKFWDPLRLQLLKVMDPTKPLSHLRSVNRLLWSPDGSRLWSASDDRTLLRWELTWD